MNELLTKLATNSLVIMEEKDRYYIADTQLNKLSPPFFTETECQHWLIFITENDIEPVHIKDIIKDHYTI